MIRMIINLVLSAFVLMLISYLLSGFVVSGFGVAIIVAVILGLVNTIVKPLVSLLTLPLNFVTFGLFSLVVNALMLALTAWIVPEFEIHNFWSAFLGALLLSLITAFIYSPPRRLSPLNTN